MKTLKGRITENQSIDEAREREYRVSLIDVIDSGIPCTVTILVPNKFANSFEKWLEDKQDDIFAHAIGGNVEY